jgi:hypothetical protein
VAINIETQDLVNYPGNVKRLVVDQGSFVPMGYEGDEQFSLSFSTNDYSDVVARTRIQTYYITNFKSGWCKSSGFLGTKFPLDSSNNSLEVKIDATTGGISDGYYRITLDHNDGIPISADVVAADIKKKIRALADELDEEDDGFKLAYKTAVAEYRDGRFWLVSGSLSNYYAGVNRSSVRVRRSSLNDCSDTLGFNLSVSSEVFSSIEVKEALVLTDFYGSTTLSGTGTITINQNIGVSVDDCMVISNGSDVDYFQVEFVDIGNVIGFDASKVHNDYEAGKAKVQLLREQDPDAEPALWFDNIDKITRHGIKTIIKQLDYSA